MGRFTSSIMGVFLFVFVVLGGLPLFSQSNQASLGGVVLDPTGARLAKAQVSITNVATSNRRETVTSKDGSFLFPFLEPGNYRLHVRVKGFSPLAVNDIMLHTSDRQSLDLKMHISTGSETVEVRATDISSRTGGEISTTVDSNFIAEMPLNGRSFQSLLLMTPGFVASTDGGLSVNGQRSDSNYYTVDGISANVASTSTLGGNASAYGSTLSGSNSIVAAAINLTGSTPNLTVMGTTQSMLSVDALDEFKVQTSTYSAEFGRQPGAQVQMTSKSGTNYYHGSLYEYLRNEALDARPATTTSTSSHYIVRQNNFGGTFGGPILLPHLYHGKNKSFFFVNYEGMINNMPKIYDTSSPATVPSDEMRSGNASNIASIYNGIVTRYQSDVNLNAGDTNVVSPTVGTYFNTCGVGSGVLNSNLTAMLKTFPVANRTTNTTGSCYFYTLKNGSYVFHSSATIISKIKSLYGETITMPDGTAKWSGNLATRYHLKAPAIKFDEIVNNKMSMNFRYSPSYSDSYTMSGASATANRAHSKTDSFTYTAQYIFSNHVGNNFNANYTTNHGGSSYTLSPHNGGVAPSNPEQVFLPNVQGAQKSFSLPSVGSLQFGDVVSDQNRQYNVTNNLSLSKGAHAFKIGVDFRYLFPKIQPVNYQMTAAFSVLALFMNSEATYLGINQQDAITVVTRNLSLYAQDSYRVTPRLTLDYGVRWEWNPSAHGRHTGDLRYIGGWSDKAGNLTLNNAYVTPAGTPYYQTPWTNFAPRVGANYRLHTTPGHETILSAGWGMFYNLGAGMGAAAANTWPHYRTVYHGYCSSCAENTYVAYPFSDAMTAPPAVSSTPSTIASGQTVLGTLDNFVLPYSQQFSASITQSLGTKQSFTISYVGSRGSHMYRPVSYTENGLNTSITTHDFNNANMRFATLYTIRNNGNWGDESRYNAMQATFNRSLYNGLQLMTNFSWSHAIDTLSSTYSVQSKWLANPGRSWGQSDADRRLSYNLALSYTTPKVHHVAGMPYLADLVTRAVVNRWSFTGMFRAQSGLPFSALYSRDMTPTDSIPAIYRLDRVQTQQIWKYDKTVLGGRSLNVNAFAVPANCLLVSPSTCGHGNTARNQFQGYAFWQPDLSIRRSISIGEHAKMQISGDLINVLNHPNWGPPSLTTLYTVSNKGVPSYANGVSTTNTLADQLYSGMNATVSLYQEGGPRSVQVQARISF